MRLKRITYRGGIVEFDIPATWKEEYEPSGGGTFYEDRPDSGTLRLNVISFTSNGKQTSLAMVSRLVATSGYSHWHDGLALKSYESPDEENGKQILTYRWEVAIPVEPCNARIAAFSYTILASQADAKEIQNEIELIENSIRNANFSRVPGVSGDYKQG